MLSEWRRVLKDGGRLILELPCMDKVFQYIALAVQQGQPMAPFMTLLPLWGDPKYRDPAMCHKWGYDSWSIMEVVKGCGFTDVKVVEPRYHFKMRDMRVEAVK